jgi:glycerophosphoryl diester phosphodiesterase
VDWLTAVPPLIIAHRGASEDAPENTLAAFALAAEQGADGVELDVRLSGDGWPVVCHDADVSRTTDGRGRVADLTVDALRALNAGAGQQIPTLDEVFEAFGPRLRYNVELKDAGLGDNGLEAAVADRIEAHHLGSQTLVSAFNPLAVRRARRHLSRATPLGFLHQTTLGRYGALLAGATAVHPHHSLVDAAYMRWAAARGYRVHVWTVDDPAEARRLLHLGVHAVITNRPATLRAALY